MINYTIPEWLAFFYIYCFFGWCFESGYASIKNKQLINRGFLRGPYIPIYAFGAIFVLIITEKFQGNIVKVYFSGMIAATVLEYITGYIMERLFRVKYWDYSDHKFNLNGYVSLSTSIAWGFLSVILTDFLQVKVSGFILSISDTVLMVSVSAVSLIFLSDLMLSVKAAFNLSRALTAVERAKVELGEIRDKLSYFTGELVEETQSKFVSIRDSVAGKVNQANEYISEVGVKRLDNFNTLKAEVENVLQSLSDTVAAKSPDYQALKRKYETAREKYNLTFPKMGKIMAFFVRNMIKGNPALNKRYLSQLKELSEIRKRKNRL